MSFHPLFCKIFFLAVFCATVLPSGSGQLQTTPKFTTTFGSTANTSPFFHCLDGSGSGAIYVTGTSDGQIGGLSSPITVANAGGDDWFTIKYSSLGIIQWIRVLQSQNNEVGQSCASDTQGSVYVTGSGNGILNTPVGIVTPTFVIPYYGGLYSDPFVAKYSSTGDIQWINNNLATPPSRVDANGYGQVILAKDNFVWVISNFQGTSNMIVTSKLDQATGNVIWTQEFFPGSANFGFGQALIDANNLIYISGFSDSGQGPYLNTQGVTIPGWTNAGGFDGFFIVYDGVSGSKLANIAQQTPLEDKTFGIAVDGTGLVYISGETYGSLQGQVAVSGMNTFLQAYLLPNFQLQWTREFSQTANSNGGQLVTDGLGGVYQIQFNDNDPGYSENHAVSSHYYGASFNKFDINGNLLWQVPLDGAAESITLDQSGILTMAGTFYSTYNFIPSDGSGYSGFLSTSYLNYNCSCSNLQSLVNQVQTLLNIAPSIS